MPYAAPNIPLQSKRGYGNRQPASNNIINGSSATILMAVSEDDNADLQPVGYIKSLTHDVSREVKKQRHILAGDAGKVVELTPGVSDHSLSANGIAMLYSATVGGRMAGTAKNGAPLILVSLHAQHKYFDVVQRFTHPATGEWVQITYGRCLIKSMRHESVIDGVDVTESCEISVSYVEEDYGLSGSAEVNLDDHDFDKAYGTVIK